MNSLDGSIVIRYSMVNASELYYNKSYSLNYSIAHCAFVQIRLDVCTGAVVNVWNRYARGLLPIKNSVSVNYFVTLF